MANSASFRTRSNVRPVPFPAFGRTEPELRFPSPHPRSENFFPIREFVKTVSTCLPQDFSKIPPWWLSTIPGRHDRGWLPNATTNIRPRSSTCRDAPTFSMFGETSRSPISRSRSWDRERLRHTEKKLPSVSFRLSCATVRPSFPAVRHESIPKRIPRPWQPDEPLSRSSGRASTSITRVPTGNFSIP